MAGGGGCGGEPIIFGALSVQVHVIHKGGSKIKACFLVEALHLVLNVMISHRLNEQPNWYSE